MPPRCPHFLRAGELVFEVNPRRARFDHGFHQLKGVQRPSETRLRIGHDGRKPVNITFVLGVLDLIGALECIIDAAHHVGHAVSRIEALIRIHLPGEIGVACHLPAAQVDRFQAGLHLLYGLVSCKRAKRTHERLIVQQLP